MAGKLTKREIDALKSRPKDYVHWDGEMKGFGVLVRWGGKKTYIVHSRRLDHRQEKLALGSTTVLTLDEAREMARGLLARMRQGGSPATERRTLRRRSGDTFALFADHFFELYVKPKAKPMRAYQVRRMLDRYLLPALGTKPLIEVSHEDIQRLHHRMRRTPVAANRTLAVVHKLYAEAERWGAVPRGSNPAVGVEKYREHRRDRYLSQQELARLGEVLRLCEADTSESPAMIAAVRLLVLTGCRLTEVLTAKWSNVDLEAGVLRLDDSKTGARNVHLNPPAVEVLQGIERIEGNPYVIVGGKPGEHLVNAEKPWRRIRKRAYLADVRLHDLRHTHASVGVSGGLSLPLVGAILGHRVPSTTQRYAHLSDDPVKEASKRIGATIDRAMNPPAEEPDNVVELPRKGRTR